LSDLFILLLSFVLTWVLGLIVPVIIRYIIVRKPLSKPVSIIIAVINLAFNLTFWVCIGTTGEGGSKTHAVQYVMALVVYYLMSKGYTQKESKKSSMEN
jgi:heme/copper-type cytochrome/quinol oxidase subunit 4